MNTSVAKVWDAVQRMFIDGHITWTDQTLYSNVRQGKDLLSGQEGCFDSLLPEKEAVNVMSHQQHMHSSI